MSPDAIGAIKPLNVRQSQHLLCLNTVTMAMLCSIILNRVFFRQKIMSFETQQLTHTNELAGIADKEMFRLVSSSRRLTFGQSTDVCIRTMTHLIEYYHRQSAIASCSVQGRS